ncbi:MAG: hypothetical protein A4E67_00247 [Syntrophaceae bacterium PtaB.Bin038]|nr:MAG: hypothetical protein A4E67_00247 [Syntrophaceae bacterium PtaB.Bin038]
MPSTSGEKLLRLPPTVKPEERPDEIIARILPDTEDRRLLAQHLAQYGKNPEANWDDYRRKIPPALLAGLKEIGGEMRRNGFFGLGAEIDPSGRVRFTWWQAVDNRRKPPVIKGELCDACSRPCERKNSAGVFRDGARRCWQKEVSHNVKA